MSYVPPQFKDANGNIFEGEMAWEKALEKSSKHGLLAIPNRPFSGKPIMIVAGQNPPNGDYRKPLNKHEFALLRKVVPKLSIKIVDSKPELSDPKLELFLREYYNMGDARISDLTWSNIFDACKIYVKTQKKKKGAQAKIHETNGGTLPEQKPPDDLITLSVAIKKYYVSKRTLQRAFIDNRIKSFRPVNAASNSPHKISEADVAKNWPLKG